MIHFAILYLPPGYLKTGLVILIPYSPSDACGSSPKFAPDAACNMPLHNGMDQSFYFSVLQLLFVQQ